MTHPPLLKVNAHRDHPRSGAAAASVSVCRLDADLIASLAGGHSHVPPLRSLLRVKVVQTAWTGTGDLPDVAGRHEILPGEIRFTPHFPFDPGLRYRASFDARPLGLARHQGVSTLEFSLPAQERASTTVVDRVFPSSAVLPENLLRFYVRFSRPMQRGRCEQQIVILAPDQRPAPDVLYRAPVELWDRGMKHLTVLLDPGRLKRGVGPNVELGPPLKPGEEYTLSIGSGMLDAAGHRLSEPFCKSFRVTEAVREPVQIEQWKITPPPAQSRTPLVLTFPRPLDWGALWRAITIHSTTDRSPIEGQVGIDRDETQWTFIPTSPWPGGTYRAQIATDLEDVCGNNLSGAFDRPLRSESALKDRTAHQSLPFKII